MDSGKIYHGIPLITRNYHGIPEIPTGEETLGDFGASGKSFLTLGGFRGWS